MNIRIPKDSETQYLSLLAKLKAEIISRGLEGTDAQANAHLIALADAALGGPGIVGVEPLKIVTAETAQIDWGVLAHQVCDLAERIGVELEKQTKREEDYDAWLNKINNEPEK